MAATSPSSPPEPVATLTGWIWPEDVDVPRSVAVVVVRGGAVPTGTADAVHLAGGTAVLIGSGVDEAVPALSGLARRVLLLEAGVPLMSAWAGSLADLLEPVERILMPASPDGRDLAPRVAAILGRPMVAGALTVREREAHVSRWGGLAMAEVELAGRLVATIVPGVVEPVADLDPGALLINRPRQRVGAESAPGDLSGSATEGDRGRAGDAEHLADLPPEVATMDLAEAPRIVAGGAGLGGSGEFADLARVGAALDAALGATRVVTDAGTVGHERQIGTTGVVVDPRLYLAFGISGAVQHTAGLGSPDHILSVNLDPHCPMMALADLAVVADAPATVAALARLLEERGGSSGGVTDTPAGPSRS